MLPEITRLPGRVAAGNCKSTFHTARHAELIREALGVSVVNGSLNVILKRPAMLRVETARRTAFGNEKPHFYWPGRINGIDVWLYRWQSAPLHVVELLATTHLRTTLGLADGDEVEVDARRCDVDRIPAVGRLAWVLLWTGRRRSTYANDRYYFPAQRWGKTFGATQLGTDKNFKDLAAALRGLALKKIFGWRWLKGRRTSGEP